MQEKKFTLWSRERREYNTDPQRRCYYGCHAKSEWHWGRWNDLYDLRSIEEAEESKRSWENLAKSSGRKLEYMITPVGVDPNKGEAGD